jgi:small subunit ribosomal protein S6
MVILDGELDEPVASDRVNQIGQQIGARGGVLHGAPDFWGKRRFAYEIKHKSEVRRMSEGYYAVMNVLAPGGALDEVERTLRLADDVVRHKLLRLPDHEAARRGMVVDGAVS